MKTKQYKLKSNEDICNKIKCTGIMVKQVEKLEGKNIWVCQKCGAVEEIE